MARRDEPDVPRLALNYYCWPFQLPEGRLGIWCNEHRYIRLLVFDLDALASFPGSEIAGWFSGSQERVYAATAPAAEFELPWSLPPGTHPINIPTEFRGPEELLIVSSCPAPSKDDPSIAVFVVHSAAQTVEVLPQRWFTANAYDLGFQWITRLARDPLSGRIIGEGIRIRPFELDDSGTEVARWLE